MNIYTRKQRWKLALLVAAIGIGITSLWYTNRLVEKLSQQEKKNVELWASAVRHLSEIEPDAGDLSFALEVLRNNNTIPMILTDAHGNINSFGNLDTLNLQDGIKWLKEQVEEMKSEQEPIEIVFGKQGEKNYVYYRDSLLIKQLRYYPFFQLAVISLFLLVSYLAFSSSRNAEQNQVWVGMAKETAHQLGTPLSSLMAWVDYLKAQGHTGPVDEIEKDIARLNTITERFSKIGSSPSLKKENVNEVVQTSINYISPRSSSKVTFRLSNPASHDVFAPMNIPLFEWVLENIFKNAVDAMSGEGSITVSITDQQQFVYIDIYDTGKGIPKSRYKTVFKPGFTSKSRGWGLGLSLSKRIVEEYHGGRIFVKSSEMNKGTTFRIVLPK